MAASTGTISEFQQAILQQAQMRQAALQCGELDVPIHYSPLPLTALLDLLAQLDYRQDALALAVPPRDRSVTGYVKRSLKKLVASALRWAFIRQVEFNRVAFKHARETDDLLIRADRNHAEFAAALTALKLQVHTMNERIQQLEGGVAGHELAPESDLSLLHSHYIDCMRNHQPIIVMAGGADLMKTLVAEGLQAQGVETDTQRADDLKERELPVILADAHDPLGYFGEDSKGSVYIGPALAQAPVRDLADLLRSCWRMMHKGGIVVLEAVRPPGHDTSGWCPPVELLDFLLESEGFTFVEAIFADPINDSRPRLARTSTGDPFDQRSFRRHAVMGRK